MRKDGRGYDALRPVSLETGWKRQGDGSVLYRAGGTVVLCVASVDEGVKDFMRGRGAGWVTAEYLMHPRTGPKRQSRDGFNGRPLSGRSQEIARLIGRALRSSVDGAALGERTITIDCDVLEADGGTRTASVTGGYVAARIAVERLIGAGLVDRSALATPIAAVSVGIVRGSPWLDLDYPLDSRADVDMNVVMDAEGRYIEVQGTGERRAMSRAELDTLLGLADGGIRQLFALQNDAIARALVSRPAV